ncbi:MAG: hypothetical protein J6P94_04825 [Oscillospiraceae bacterium]|nr:hypothetical protein [Oscillospiraceae bacterium]
MDIYRIFVSNMGEFRNHKKYEFVADFGDVRMASQYVTYMRGRKHFANKDIIIKVVPIGAIDTSLGVVDGVVTVMGESLPVEECDFT